MRKLEEALRYSEAREEAWRIQAFAAEKQADDFRDFSKQESEAYKLMVQEYEERRCPGRGAGGRAGRRSECGGGCIGSQVFLAVLAAVEVRSWVLGTMWS